MLKEPLLHFLLLAAGLFAVSGSWGRVSESDEQDTIVVSEARILSLAQMFQRTWQRPPTRIELEGLIDDYITEEVLYREALKMGLDQDDTVIRRRLRQKLEFVAEDLADAVEPTDVELQEFLNQHPAKFRLPDRATFTQIYLNPERHGETLREEIEELLIQVRSSEEPIDPASLGDPFLLPHYFEDTRAGEIANLFGHEFSPRLLAAEMGKWSGPIESSYGVHLVLLHERTEGRVPDLDEVRDAVQREWHAARRAVSKEMFYQGLKEQYAIVVRMPTEENE
jgi:hypothetical protein